MLTGKRSARTGLTMGMAGLAAVLLLACHKALPPDGVCSYEPLPPAHRFLRIKAAFRCWPPLIPTLRCTTRLANRPQAGAPMRSQRYRPETIRWS